MAKAFLIVTSMIEVVICLALFNSRNPIEIMFAPYLFLCANISWCAACIMEYIQKAPLWQEQHDEKRAGTGLVDAATLAEATPPLGVRVPRPEQTGARQDRV